MNSQDKVMKLRLGLLEVAKQLGNFSLPARSWATAGTPSTGSMSCTRRRRRGLGLGQACRDSELGALNMAGKASSEGTCLPICCDGFLLLL